MLSRVVDPLFKRPLDILLSAVGLLVSLPIWVGIIAAIMLEDGRPVFFGQERIGRHGRKFRVLKFRSMLKDNARTEVQARRGDPRITRVGWVLRRFSLDELPQLLNILRGDMSFVGPRAQPEREIVVLGGREREVVVRMLPGFEMRQRVRPGLTGVAQLFAPREVPHRHKFRYDLIYARRLMRHAALRNQAASSHSATSRLVGAVHVLADGLDVLWLDVRLIIRSVWLALLGKWEV